MATGSSSWPVWAFSAAAWEERRVPVARLAPGRDGRPHARQRFDPRRHDGGRGVTGWAILSGIHARSAAGDRVRGLHHAVHRRYDRATATDIKRVLAYSTVSQFGYMMLALGLGGWLAA